MLDMCAVGSQDSIRIDSTFPVGDITFHLDVMSAFKHNFGRIRVVTIAHDVSGYDNINVPWRNSVEIDIPRRRNRAFPQHGDDRSRVYTCLHCQEAKSRSRIFTC